MGVSPYMTRTRQSILINKAGERGRSSRPGFRNEFPCVRLGKPRRKERA